MDINIVKKNSNEFSAVKEVLSEVNNSQFKSGESDFYSLIDDAEGSLSADTSKSYIWTALSAVADDAMEAIYQNVLNYIDNVSNIDTCSVKALQSMVQILGAKFSVFENLVKCPVEVMNLIDVFSMRRDYLLNSEKVCSKLMSSLSVDSDEGILDSISIKYPFISQKKLDNVVSAAFYDVLSSHVYRKYGSFTNTEDYIYENLSTAILENGFEIPNSYADAIKNQKTKMNITEDFDEEKEVDMIDNGLSAYSDYTEREQTILDLEIQRRISPISRLEPKTRYAYYKEKDVKDYFSFIETTYNNSLCVYAESLPYIIDKNYIEINSLSAGAKLAYSGGSSSIHIDDDMIKSVAYRLQMIVTQIRDIRQYLKSHVQRTYMKGTFLLLSYIVNEYLKNNVYPVLSSIGYDDVQFSTERNNLELVEYIDQTQYNNIETDIHEDYGRTDLNPEYWKGTGSNGTAVSLDSSNIFRPADRMKLVTTGTFQSQEIEDFYLNVLNERQQTNSISSQDTLCDFLEQLFKVGADNSYLDSSGKVMCELNNTEQSNLLPMWNSTWNSGRRFTKDIENYILQLSTDFQNCRYLMNGYSPLPNITYQEQIDEVKAQYDLKAYDAYSAELSREIEDHQKRIDEIDNVIIQIDDLNIQYNDLTSSFSSLVISQSPATGNIDLKSPFFSVNLGIYASEIDKKTIPEKQLIKNQIKSFENQYNRIFTEGKKIIDELKVVKSFVFRGASFNDHMLTSKYSIIDIGETLFSDYYKVKHINSIQYLENILKTSLDDLTVLKTELQMKLEQISMQAREKMTMHINNSFYSELSSLSATLGSFLQDQSNINTCVEDIQKKLDYTQSDWYKYKENLFYKYTGLSVSQIPFYYIENQRHPSYQIHPCLSNFIEYIDYSFPVHNLAGLADKIIDDIASYAVADFIDNDGYLLSVWNNPLNGNDDYLTRYEKADHIDETGKTNKFFGFDGLWHPEIEMTTDLGSVADLLVHGQAENTLLYKGLNMSIQEQKLVGDRLKSFKSLISKIADGTYSTEILRYGIDIYENSYILLKVFNISVSCTTLWFKPKNYPIAFPAIVYNSSGQYDSALSEIDLTKDNSNKFLDDKLNQIKKSTLPQTGNNYMVPEITDFIFSTDRTTMLINGIYRDTNKEVSIIANVVQQFENDYDKQYFSRTFAVDKTDTSLEKLDVPNNFKFAAFYTEGRHIGQICRSEIKNNKIEIDVQKYYQDNVLAFLSPSFILSGEADVSDIKSGLKAEDIMFSCRSDGTFSMAYVGEKYLPNTSVQTYTGELFSKYDQLKENNIDIFENPLITHDFRTLDESLSVYEESKSFYAPFTEMGFIYLSSDSTRIWELNDTTFADDFKNGKVLKFKFDKKLNDIPIPEKSLPDNLNSKTLGIDFKYLCPIRVEELESAENTSTSLNVQDSYTDDVAFQRPYGKSPLPEGTKLKHYAITDVHVFDSFYNQYVLSGNIPEVFELTPYEAYLFDEKNRTQLDVFTEYNELMNYDVARYLSAQIAENGDLFSTRMEFITQPFLVSTRQYYQLADSAYINGYVSTTKNYFGQYRISLGDVDGYPIEISADIMKNDIGEIKIDFNSIYYFNPDIDSDHSLRGQNTRNKLHLFLNLDKPGDSGYLNIYRKTPTSHHILHPTKHDLLATVFIKNISTTEPKFILKAVHLDPGDLGVDESLQAAEIDISNDKKSHMFRSSLSTSTSHQPMILADESFEGLPIEFS